jgi:hypothetical protein
MTSQVNQQKELLIDLNRTPDTQKPVSKGSVRGHTVDITSQEKTNTIKNAVSVIFNQLRKLIFKADSFIHNKLVEVNVDGNKSVSVRLPYPRNVKIKSADITKIRVPEAGANHSLGELKALLDKPYGPQALIPAFKGTDKEGNIYLLHALQYLNQLINDDKEAEAKHVMNEIKKTFIDENAPLKVSLESVRKKEGAPINTEFLNNSKNLLADDFRNDLNAVQQHIIITISQSSAIINSASDKADKMIKSDEDFNSIINGIEFPGVS